MYADAAGAEPDAVKRAELLGLCMTCWRQAQMLRPVARYSCEGMRLARAGRNA